MQEKIKGNLSIEKTYKIITIASICMLFLINLIAVILIFVKRINLTNSIIFIIGNILIITLIMICLFKLKKLKEDNLKIFQEKMIDLFSEKTNIVKCDVNNFLNTEELYQLGVIPYSDIAYGNFLTTYKTKENKTNIFSNIVLKLKFDNNSEYHCEKTIFKGQLYILNHKTKIKGHIRILSSYKNHLLNIEYLNHEKDIYNPETKIETESIEFNDNFEVYATDEHFAFYLLKSELIYKLLDLKKKYGFFNICITGDKLILARKTDKILFKEKIDENLINDFSEEKIREEITELLYFGELFEELLNK